MALLDKTVDWIMDSILGSDNELSRNRHRHDCPEESRRDGDKLARLAPGTPVFCYFTGEIAEHTGICLGDTIVHLNGTGEVICTSPEVFLARLEGKNIAFDIFYAAAGPNEPLGSPEIAERAKAAIGKTPGYDLLSANCHQFCIQCILDEECATAPSIRNVEAAISKFFQTEEWHWRNWDGFKTTTGRKLISDARKEADTIYRKVHKVEDSDKPGQ